MTDNYLDKYKEEDSVSSESGEDHMDIIKNKLAKQSLNPSNEPKQELQVEKKSERRRPEEDKVTPYTFNPRSVLDSDSSTGRDYLKKKPYDKPNLVYTQPVRDYGYSNIRVPKEYSSSVYSRYTSSGGISQYKKDLEYPQMEIKNDYLKSLQYDLKEEPTSTDPKSENEYRAIAKEFDSEFGDRQRDVAEMSRQLMSRIKKLQMMAKDISAPNSDMSLLRTRLLHELATTQSDLNDANNNVILLMNDRVNIKNKYCYLKMRNKELKNFVKVFQENIRSYFLI